MRRGTLILIIALFVLIAVAAVWQLILFMGTEPTTPPGPLPS